MNVLAPALLVAAAASAACGAPLMKLPPGPGAPAPDGIEALAQATAACKTIQSMTAEASVGGRVGAQRLRARLLLGVADPDLARIEAFAFGQPVFVFVTKGGDATLVLNRDGRVLEHGRPSEVLEALTGAPLDGPGLRSTLTGCATPETDVSARQLAEHWRVVSDAQHDWYLQRASRAAPWRLVTTIHRAPGQPDWRAEYREIIDGVAHHVHLVSANRDRFDIEIRLADPERNVALGAEAFQVNIPPGATPITIEEFRASGLFAEADDQ